VSRRTGRLLTVAIAVHNEESAIADQIAAGLAAADPRIGLHQEPTLPCAGDAGPDRWRLAHRLLGQYDVVFAKAKAAMEAMAVGTAVILCDFSGIGPIVTSTRFEELRPLNFGFEALRDPLEPEHLLREIARYDPEDAPDVAALHQSTVPAAGRHRRWHRPR
jgi:hypothetical protein